MTDPISSDRTAERDALLLAVLPHVAFDGWTRQALRLGAEDAGFGLDDAATLFPGGIAELAEHLHDWADRAMLERLAEEGEAFEALRVREKIAQAVMARLDILLPYRDAVRRDLSRRVLRPLSRRGLHQLHRTVDAMWRAAGDRSTDINYYSKRGLLAGVYASTLLVWLDDRSEGQETTRAFLERRIGEVLAFGRQISGLKRLGDLAEAPFRLAARLREGRETAAP
ncbi:COQ9 family protein [Inquilinus limosus]|uniref:COQ9 family protein n=1 Tax=Inquilinus limosus TaxID=171674 RepID=UPI003F141EE7